MFQSSGLIHLKQTFEPGLFSTPHIGQITVGPPAGAAATPVGAPPASTVPSEGIVGRFKIGDPLDGGALGLVS